MYPKPRPHVETGRVRTGPMASVADWGNNGCFILIHEGVHFVVIASDGAGWEHVSVSIKGMLERPKEQRRCPRWEEMCWIKDQFWPPEECVVQYHPPASDNVNLHPYCLHLWRPCDGILPMPPAAMVGPKGVTVK